MIFGADLVGKQRTVRLADDRCTYDRLQAW